MEQKKMISIGAIVIGLLGLIVSAVWDYFPEYITGTQTTESIGIYQYAGIAIGVIIAIVGAALLVVKKKPGEEKKE